MTTVIQRSFAGGVISPHIWAHPDQVKYQTGATTLRNYVIRRNGSLDNRAGTEFIGEIKDSSKTGKLARFRFSATQKYVLEFGDKYIRFIRDGGYIQAASESGDDFSSNSVAGIYAIGDWVKIGNYRIFAFSGLGGDGNLYVAAPYGTDTSAITIALATNSADSVAVTWSGGVLTIKLANATSANNAAVLIQAAVRGANAIFSNFTVTEDAGYQANRPTNGSAPAGVMHDGNKFYIALVAVTPDAGNSHRSVFPGSDPATWSNQAVYEVATPYAFADLPNLEYAQSGDVITFTHPSYPVYDLSRFGDANWTMTQSTFAPSVTAPDGATVDAGASGSKIWRYRVTAVADNGEESLPGKEGAKAIEGITQASPGVITITGHGYVTKDEIFISGAKGMTQLNGNTYLVKKIGANSFSLTDAAGNDISTAAFTAWTSAGSVARTFVSVAAAQPTATHPNVITIPAQNGIKEFIVYKEDNGIYGFIGVSQTTSDGTIFNDVGIDADTTDSPPAAFDPFVGADNYPSTVTYFQQRKMFGNSNKSPEKVWGSKIGNYPNFAIDTPVKDDSTLSFSLAGNQVNPVRHMADLGSLIVFTDAGEWSISGDAAGALTPSAINARSHSYAGSNNLRPLLVGARAIFCQARSSIVRDLAFDWRVNGYRGDDLTIFASHLFEGYTLVDWDYAQIPNYVVWAVRSDGVLLGLTYIQEQEIWGWHHHDFKNGLVENVISVPEGNEDVLYLIVKRTINGSTKRYVERMSSRVITDILDANFLDSVLEFDGRNTGATTMTLSGGTTWAYDETLVLAASVGFFTNGMIGDQIWMPLASGDFIRCTIVSYTSATVVGVKPHKTLPAELRGVAKTAWERAVTSVSGADHLEGEAVGVYANGFVVASPNNTAVKFKPVVTAGVVTLDKAYSYIRVGLPIIADFESLDLDTPTGETMQDKAKLITRVNVYVKSSRGIFAGTQAPSDDATDPLKGLVEEKIRGDASENYDDPVALQTGVAQININATWDRKGRVFIRQVDPLPLSILSIAPSGYIPIKER